MTQRTQRRAAIAGAFLLVGLFAAANAHLLHVAVTSEPACVARPDAAPARIAC